MTKTGGQHAPHPRSAYLRPIPSSSEAANEGEASIELALRGIHASKEVTNSPLCSPANACLLYSHSLGVYLFVGLFVGLFACLSVCLFVCLLACLLFLVRVRLEGGRAIICK